MKFPFSDPANYGFIIRLLISALSLCNFSSIFHQHCYLLHNKYLTASRARSAVTNGAIALFRLPNQSSEPINEIWKQAFITAVVPEARQTYPAISAKIKNNCSFIGLVLLCHR